MAMLKRLAVVTEGTVVTAVAVVIVVAMMKMAMA